MVNIMIKSICEKHIFIPFYRHDKLLKLSLVLNADVHDDNVPDPDNTYELTADNVKKILAIHMRFRQA